MIWIALISQILVMLLILKDSYSISSPVRPFTKYQYSTELEKNVADLWWSVDDVKQEIMFELHIKTRGWIALGISPAGGMTGADIGMGWIGEAGNVHFQDRYAFNFSKPILDTTTMDWHGLQGREQNGWTAIQFKRLLDTCDSMDVPIKSGTNILIFAYGLMDPNIGQLDDDISYHENRRGSRIIPLQSYSDPPPESKFAEFDSFDFLMNNYLVPPTDTTYYCKVFKLPSHFPMKRHAIAHKIIIDSTNRDLVHHMDTYECHPETTNFDDTNLPEGECDQIVKQIKTCVSNMMTMWSVGADHVSEYVPEAGYPIGGDLPVKYFMVQVHYDNARLLSNRRDSSGIKFYVDSKLRQYDLGYVVFGLSSSAYGIAIPPHVDRFIIDSYCPTNFSKNFPESGITVIGALPHTHLQGNKAPAECYLWSIILNI
ncbi:unnamed protein product [Rotaria sp. Silwood1]|nr:unnamed protein product [Rotaria sp. Silwood1]